MTEIIREGIFPGVKRVALLGGESSGKTTLAARLAETLGEPWAAEFGRDMTIAKQGEFEFGDLLLIGQMQCVREDQAAKNARGWLICDTTPLTTLWYSIEMFGRADPKLIALAERRYDVYLLCLGDIPFVQDGWRADEATRARFERWYRDEMKARGIKFYEIGGSLEQRTERALAAIEHSLDSGRKQGSGQGWFRR